MRIVVALGGNALLERDEPPEAAVQLGHIQKAAHLDLLVIPPDTATFVALACLTMQTLAATPPEREQESRWEDDGGRLREPNPPLVGAAPLGADEPRASRVMVNPRLDGGHDAKEVPCTHGST